MRGPIMVWTAAVVLSAGACTSKPQTPAERGRQVYMSNCIVCHGVNPSLPGSQGPPIAGSSRDLVEARLLHLSYPPGYKPKRTTHAMRAFPELKGHIDDLTAFLDQAGKTQSK